MTASGRPPVRGQRSIATFVVAGLPLVLAAGFIALGVWQLERRVWKLDLIERVEARVTAAPVAPPAPEDRDDFDPGAIEYLSVAENGRYLDRDVLVKAVTTYGGGFWVLTPFLADDGTTILVNRGFIAQDDRRRERSVPDGESMVRGLVRLSEPDGGFLRSNDPAEGRWYSRDVPAIAEALGIDPDRLAPYFVDAEAGANGSVGESAPIGGLTVVSFRNTHLVYALTWFALAAMSIGASVLVIRARHRPSSGSAAEHEGAKTPGLGTGASTPERRTR